MQHQPEKYWSLISHKTPHEPSKPTKKQTLYEPQILTQDVLTPPSVALVSFNSKQYPSEDIFYT